MIQPTKGSVVERTLMMFSVEYVEVKIAVSYK